jgi:chromosome segregation ATPase
MAKKTFKVGLPGILYQKSNRWWWKVKLPGETRLKDMGLKSKSARFATTDRGEAEELALGIWESTIRREVQAQARAKAREKAKSAAKEMASVRAQADATVSRMKVKIMDSVANAKAQCEEKLRQCNAVAEQADEKVRAEADKKAALEAEYEEKLSQCEEARAQAQEAANAEAKRTAALEAEYEEKLSQCEEALAKAREAADAESARTTALEAEYEEKLRQCEETLAQTQEVAEDEPQQPMQAEPDLEVHLVETKPTGTCDCCGRADIPEDELATIDSGHRFCAECLGSLRR